MRFLSLPKIILFFASIFSRKNRENHRFWLPKTLPKPTQNPFKIDVPKNIRFFIEFCSKNALLQQRQHRFRIGFSNTFCLSGTFLRIAFRMHFGSKKPTKNQSKTTSEPFKFQKSMSKMCRFSTSIFSGFGLDFGGLWVSNLEPSWLSKP